MKKVFARIALFLVVAVAANAQGVLKFTKESHDFGKLNEGPQATYSFEVANTGTAPVVISNAMASCGCTTPEWSKEPIMPGQKSVIKVGYNTQGRVGPFNKTITVASNAENSSIVLTIRGEVAGSAAVAAPVATPAVTPAAIVPAKAPAKKAPAKKATTKKAA
jgi:Protein of unknown function (DUF1573)